MNDILSWFDLINNNILIAIAVLTYMLVWAVKKYGVKKHYLPLTSIGIGAVAGLATAFVFKSDIYLGIYDGVISGLIAVGGRENINALINSFTKKEGK